MKKLAILIATMLMLCVMATACGGDKDNSTNSTDSASSTTTATAGGSVSTTASTTASASTSTTSTGTVTPPTGSTVATSMVSTEVAVGNFANGTELANGFFANGVSKDIVVDSSSAVSFGTYTDVTNRIKLGGAMDATKKNSIKFTVDKACTLTVYAKGGNSTEATRAGWVINEAGAQVGEVSAPFPTSSSPAMAMFDIPTAGTYYFGGNVNGINVYAMSIS